MPKSHSPDPNRSSSISPDIHIGLPLPITGLTQVEQGKVSFRAKDYRKGGKKKTLCLDAHEFLRRFALHILPRRFVRIRHFGLLAPNQKKQALRSIREQLGQPQPEEVINLSWKQLLKEATGIDLEQCPKCKHGKMIPDKVLPRAPPDLLD